MEENNPFAAPTSDGNAEKTLPASELTGFQTLSAMAVPIFLGWEKLRLIYIGVLVVASVFAALMHNGLIHTFDFLACAIFGAVVTNVCYFAGPIVEAYLTWLKLKPLKLRIGLFVVGTIFSTVLAMLAVYNLADSLAN